jgi:hypothetical protein
MNTTCDEVNGDKVTEGEGRVLFFVAALIAVGVLVVAVSATTGYFYFRHEGAADTKSLASGSDRHPQQKVSVQTKPLLKPQFLIASFVVARPMLSGLVGALVLVVIGVVIGVAVWQTTTASQVTTDPEHQKKISGNGSYTGTSNAVTEVKQPWKIPVIVVGCVLFVGLILGGVFLVRHVRSTKGAPLPGPGTNLPGPPVGPGSPAPSSAPSTKKLTDLKTKCAAVQTVLSQLSKKYLERYNSPCVLISLDNVSPVDVTIESALSCKFGDRFPVFIKCENGVLSTETGDFVDGVLGTIVFFNWDMVDEKSLKVMELIDRHLDAVLSKAHSELEELGSQA